MVDSIAGGGTGWAYSSDLIITNKHVVELGSTGVYVPGTFVIMSDGRQLPAFVVGVHDTLDVAVLRVEPGSLKPLPLSPTPPALGQLLVVIGYPLSVGPQVSLGVFSMDNGTEFYTDADISPGNSGSPVLNPDGAVVGMVSGIVQAGYGDGWAVAVPGAEVQRAIDEILNCP